MVSKRIKELALDLKSNPEDSFIKFALALELIKVGELEKARLLFESIRSTDPDYVGVYYHLGKLYEQLHREEEALTIYKEGIQKTEQLGDQHARSELQAALMNLQVEMN